MSGPFDLFVVFAEMRTGSNFLESNLNTLEGVACHGEAFNPHFIGYPNRTDCLGLTQEERDADPSRLVQAVREAPGLNGFRYFHDHDARILDAVMDDPRCAKIVLTRNPLDSYVSWKIARETGQWKLTDVHRRKEARVRFDASEFEAHVTALQMFQVEILRRLQVSGQTAFHLGYEDLNDLDVMNGLARWLGTDQRFERVDRSLKVQNPEPVEEKVTNPEEIGPAIARLDRFSLGRTPNFEPRRGPAVPTYVAGAEVPLLYMPVRGGPEEEVRAWLAGLDGVDPGDLPSRMNQKALRQWKRARPGHRSFTVVRHPVPRAHDVFCRRILSTGEGSYAAIRDTLRRQFKVLLPKDEPGEDWTPNRHRAAFEGFLDFLKANLSGQTAIRVDGEWCTQAQTIQTFADFALPDHVFREEELGEALPRLARSVGRDDAGVPESLPHDTPISLAEIYDDRLEARVAAAYQRDYLTFGFREWGAG